MDKLHCPGCKSDRIRIQSRKRYFSWAVLCLAIALVTYLILINPLLRPGEWDGFKMMLTVLNETAFCISIILFVYFLVSGIFKKQTTYTCRDCNHQFSNTSLLV
jgi:Zn finger protein HypA/HybF involved in hydrogenase expression